MNKHEFISREISIWGEDYVFDLIDRGYEPVQLNVNNASKWWWVDTTLSHKNPLTQDGVCAIVGSARLR